MLNNSIKNPNFPKTDQNEARLLFECFGVNFEICTNKPDFLDKVRTVLPVGTIERENKGEKPFGEAEHRFDVRHKDEADEWILKYGERELLRRQNPKWIIDILRSALRQRVAENTVERVFIHAGVVAWNDCLILIPGKSFAGKTTLTAELVKAGAVYYSDEFAMVDKNGLVHPYQKPLSMRRRNSSDGSQTDIAVEQLNGSQGVTPLPIGLVVITRYKARSRWKPEVLSPGIGVLEILKHTNNSLRHPEIVLPVLQKVAKQARIIKSNRGDAKKAANAILLECAGQ